jgi:uncharacterized protein (DUF2252 family)
VATRSVDRQSTREERAAAAKALRAIAPRKSHASWSPPAGRADPVALLEDQAKTRVPELVPIRHARMAASPFAFFRGSAGAMAADLAHTPASGIRVMCCGDAHLSNFGVYATPERHLVFDLNDFDETLPAPFEWDVKRLAASVAVAGRGNGFGDRDCRTAARAAVRSYRDKMLGYAAMGYLDVWYSRVDVDAVLELVQRPSLREEAEKDVEKARARTSAGALPKLTEVVGGRRRIKDDPPLVSHLEAPGLDEALFRLFRAYARTLQEDRRELLSRYEYVDFARKVVGIGSVGTETYVLLLMEGGDDPLFLQVKEAQASVLEPYAGASAYENNGKRIVTGQRLMQAASDVFLGWIRDPRAQDFYVRQLRDMKGSADVESMDEPALTFYAEICGWALARAHARSGDAASISGYVGTSDSFDRALAEFAVAYADQTQRDHAALVAAVESGRLVAA